MQDKHPTLLLITKIIIVLFAIVGFVFIGTYFAIRFGWTNQKGTIDTQQKSFIETSEWKESEEWKVLEEAILRDKDVINKAAQAANIEPRLLVSALVVEQLRLFYSDRELFETAFEPLKILGSQNVMSLGIMGIKPETAVIIENNLVDTTSVFYPGKKYSSLLNFNSQDKQEERFKRLTNTDDHYFSYLYASLCMKQIITQWQKAGYPIEDKPGIILTLYNIGFQHSFPKPNPEMGGAEIDIGKESTNFGRLGEDFYKSDKLEKEFPRK